MGSPEGHEAPFERYGKATRLSQPSGRSSSRDHRGVSTSSVTLHAREAQNVDTSSTRQLGITAHIALR